MIMDKPINLVLGVILISISHTILATESTHRIDANSIAQMPDRDCIIEPSEIVDLGTAVSGLIKSIRVDRSDRVEKDHVVVQLESGVEQASVNLASARAKLDTAIELRKASLELGYVTQRRSTELLQSAAISVQDMDQIKTDIRVAELNLRQEQDNKRMAGMDLSRAMAILQQRKIKSPVTGVVMERFKSVGEFVDDDAIMRIAKLDPLHVEVIMPVDYLGSITPGMQAKVTPVIGDSQTHFATVERVDQVVDAASGTFGVQLSLPNPDYKITAGLRCTMAFVDPDQKNQEKIASNASGEKPGTRP